MVIEILQMHNVNLKSKKEIQLEKKGNNIYDKLLKTQKYLPHMFAGWYELYILINLFSKYNYHQIYANRYYYWSTINNSISFSNAQGSAMMCSF